MSGSSVGSRGNGVGFGTVLFIVFLVLKLTGVIAWSWWWVTAPLWIPVLVVVVLFIVAGGLTLIGKRSRR